MMFLSEPIARDLASSDVVGHGAGTLFQGLPPSTLKTPGIAESR